MKPKREKAEQRARRIGRGLGFYLMPPRKNGGWWGECDSDGNRTLRIHGSNGQLVKLWRALERSQRALARERGKRP